MAIKISSTEVIDNNKVHKNPGPYPVWENSQAFTANYTITNSMNAMSAGPISINLGVTVTVGSGETWTVV